MIYRNRSTARPTSNFVLFLIGMRINRPLLIHKWLPIVAAMPKMIAELYRQPELGFLSHEMWFSRTIILVQYWRDIESLNAYAKSKTAAHLPAWQKFNQSIGTDGSVGIWHETYDIKPGSYENVYVNMPPFGLGKVGPIVDATGVLKTASGRMHGKVE